MGGKKSIIVIFNKFHFVIQILLLNLCAEFRRRLFYV